jgi:FkbM family methyltransferase
MSPLKHLKRAFIFPFRRNVPTIRVGGSGTWAIVDPHKKALFVISAGVGLGIDFEQGIAERWDVDMLLLDPSPTGVSTIDRIGKVRGITFHSIGLAAEDGTVAFAKPLSEKEGSFFIANRNIESDALIKFECKCLTTLMEEHGRDAIDILKIDIEGAEYEVIDGILREGIKISQICVEIHTHHRSGSQATIWDAARLILRLYCSGYRIVFNSAMDFTFVHRSVLP